MNKDIFCKKRSENETVFRPLLFFLKKLAKYGNVLGTLSVYIKKNTEDIPDCLLFYKNIKTEGVKNEEKNYCFDFGRTFNDWS